MPATVFVTAALLDGEPAPWMAQRMAVELARLRVQGAATATAASTAPTTAALLDGKPAPWMAQRMAIELARLRVQGAAAQMAASTALTMAAKMAVAKGSQWAAATY